MKALILALMVVAFIVVAGNHYRAFYYNRLVQLEPNIRHAVKQSNLANYRSARRKAIVAYIFISIATILALL